jgi:hypothetical protein
VRGEETMDIPARLIIGAVVWACAGPAAATNIVQNPGFEQGTASWDYEHFALGPSPLWAHTDPGMARLTYCASESCLDTLNSGAYIGQLLATTPGQFYELSFWVRSFTGESRLSVFWDGVLLTETGTPNGPMLQYSFSGLVASANATLLQLHGYNSLNQHMSFDDFSVVQTAGAGAPMAPAAPATPAAPAAVQAVSEPGVYALLLAALGALVVAKRRKS